MKNFVGGKIFRIDADNVDGSFCENSNLNNDEINSLSFMQGSVIAILVVFILLCVAIIVILLRRKRKSKKSSKSGPRSIQDQQIEQPPPQYSREDQSLIQVIHQCHQFNDSSPMSHQSNLFVFQAKDKKASTLLNYPTKVKLPNNSKSNIYSAEPLPSDNLIENNSSSGTYTAAASVGTVGTLNSNSSLRQYNSQSTLPYGD